MFASLVSTKMLVFSLPYLLVCLHVPLKEFDWVPKIMKWRVIVKKSKVIAVEREEVAPQVKTEMNGEIKMALSTLRHFSSCFNGTSTPKVT